MASLPSGTLYGTVVGQFIQAVADGVDADRLPDVVPVRGNVAFAPSAQRIVIAAATPNPLTVFQQPITATLDSEGYLVGPDGARGIVLIASDSPGNPTGFTYTATLNLEGVPGFSFSFYLVGGTTVDLSTVIPVSADSGALVPTDVVMEKIAKDPTSKFALYWQSKIDTAQNTILDQALNKAANLGDVLNKATARANLSVPARSEVPILDGQGRVPEGNVQSRLLQDNLDARTRQIVSETVINVQTFGVKPGGTGLGVAADVANYNTMVAAFNASPNTRGIYFPGHDLSYPIAAGAVFSKSVKYYGDSRDASKCLVVDNAQGDVITMNGGGPGRSPQIADITIDGNKNSGARGDLVVLDVGYATIRNVMFQNAGGTAIRQGKANRAIIANIDGAMIRLALNYGIWVQQDSTDALWNNLDIGTCGLSGVRVESSSQNMSNVHVWGCGTRGVTDDASGFLILSSGNQMSTCQAETNWDDGFTFRDVDQNGSMMSACKSWANGLAGFAFFNYSRPAMAACTAYDNAMRNTEGPTSTNRRYAGFYNSNSNHGAMAGCKAFDRSVARDVTTPSPIMSKAAVVTQVYGYAEETGATPFGWAISGNGLGTTMVNANGSTFEANRTPNSVTVLELVGSSLPIRGDHKIIKATTSVAVGTDVTFNTMGTDSQVGRIVTVQIEATNIVVFENSTIKLVGGSFRGGTWTASGTSYPKQITFQWNGAKWVEIGRIAA